MLVDVALSMQMCECIFDFVLSPPSAVAVKKKKKCFFFLSPFGFIVFHLLTAVATFQPVPDWEARRREQIKPQADKERGGRKADMRDKEPDRLVV